MKEVLKTIQYKKKGSPNILVIGPNDWMNDPKEYPDWFVDITLYSKKSKKPKESSTIIKKDLEGHLRMYIKEGWKELDEKEYVDIFTEKVETKKKK
jgi:hypothetical protein